MPPLPTTGQITAGIIARLAILWPIFASLLAGMWMFGVLPPTDTRITGGVVILIVLALDSAFRPVPVPAAWQRAAR